MILLVLVTLLVGGCTGWSRAASTPTAVEADVARARDQYLEAYHAGKVDDLSALFAADARFGGTIGAGWLHGREAIRANWDRLFKTYARREMVFQSPEVRAYGPTMSVETGNYRMRLTDATGQTREMIARYSITRILVDGHWLIANFHASRTAEAP